MKKIIAILIMALLLTTPALAQVPVQGLPVVTSATANDYMPIDHYISAGVFATSRISLANLTGAFASASYPTGSGIPIVSGGTSWGTTISNGTGYLHNNGAGVYSYSVPSSMVYPGVGIAYTPDGASWGTSFGVGTMTNGYLCTYATSGNTIACNTAPATFQSASAKLTAIGALANSAGALTNDGSGNFSYNTYVTGPASATANDLMCAADTTGKVLEDCGAKTTDNSTASTATSTHYLKKDTSGYIANSPIIERIGATFDGGGSAIALNKIAYVYVPFAGTITEWTLICNSTDASLIIDVLRLTFTAATLPTASMIGAGNHIVPTNVETQAAPNGSWTSTAIAAGDVLGFKVTTGATTAVWCHASLDVTR